MWFRVDPTSAVGLADQIAARVRAALLESRLTPGDRLPPAREVARGLDINMHTVLRGYAILRDEGLIELRRGRGARVRTDVDVDLTDLRQQIRALVGAAQRLGISREGLITEMRKVAQ
ncbi:MAG TPA: GntR family transcriptional regulator [Nocardioidaceae bacterium]|nr:GntR family transcriptional regulator [Nocardioidaceae bacterium]